MRIITLRLAIALAVFSFSSSLATDALAQIKVEIGEEVKVPVLNDWLDGVVIDIERQQVLVEYEFASSKHQRAFHRREVRRLYEYQGLDYGRRWKSSDGSYEVEASLLRIDGDKVVLIKPNLKEVTVPIEKLSGKDRGYVKKFQSSLEAAIKRGEVPDIIPELPEVEKFSGSSFGSRSTYSARSNRSMTRLGALPSYMKDFKQAGVGFNLIRNDQRLVAVIPVGGPEQLVLMSFREQNPFKKGERFQSQLYWVSLKKQKVTGFVSITHEDYALDYDPKSRILLTFNRNEEFIGETDEPDHYTAWKLEPGGTKAEPLVRWEGQGMGWADNLFGKVINKQMVVVKIDRKTYQAFDFVEKKSAYIFKTHSFFDAPVVLSPDRKSLILPEDGRVTVIDAALGDVTMSARVKDRHVSGANVNDAGTKLAALTERNVYVWDLESGNANPTIYPAPLMGSPFKARVEWIDDDHILGESHQERILYRLSLQLPIWSYRMNVSQYFLNRDPMKNMVVNGRFFYVARPEHFGSAFAVGAVDLPGPGVSEVTKEIDRESLLILKKGVPVSLDFDNISEPGKVKSWLVEKIESNGWDYDPNADIVMHAAMGIGETQNVTYEEFGGGNETTVSFRPHFATLVIKKDDTIIWQSGTSTSAPSIIHGENARAEVNRYQNPQVQFFKNVVIDSEIIDPKYSRGFGVSELGLRGIEVISTSPPGRENDPFAASQQADEDQKKAAEEERESKRGNEDQ